MKSVLADEVVDELEELVFFQVNEIPLYDNVTPGICAFISSCNDIEFGNVTCIFFPISDAVYEIPSILNDLFPISVSIALIIAAFKLSDASAFNASAAVYLPKPSIVPTLIY
jgi:hypothetical protein